MIAVISSPDFVEIAIGCGLAAAAAALWIWRRGVAARRIAKGLRSYTSGVQVTS
jgi:hypothetical protein